MKNFIVLMLIVFSITACDKKPEGFSINGTITNAVGKTLYFDELTPSGIEQIDSVIINDDGTFSFSGFTNEPKFFLIRFDRKNFIHILVDSLDKIKITANGNDMPNTYTVEGSADSKLIKELMLDLNHNTALVDSLGSIYRKNMDIINDSSVIKKPNIDSLKIQLDKSYNKILDNRRNFVISYIKKNTSSLTCLMAIYQTIGKNTILNPKDHIAYFNKVDSALTKKYPNSKHSKALHAQVVEIKKRLEQANTPQSNFEIGSTVPDIKLPNPDGDSLSLSDFKGKFVLLDFWASWCRPCREENPNLIAAYKKYNSKEFEILQVSVDKTKDVWLKAIKEDKLKWNHVIDMQTKPNSPAVVYNIQSIPTNFLLDKEGKIIAKNLRGQDLEKKLAEIIK